MGYNHRDIDLIEDLPHIHPDMDPIERKIILMLLDDALEAGYSISVMDGEEIVLEKSQDGEEIFEALYSTASDTLRFYKAYGCLGWIRLIYGNRECVVSDYADNDAMEHLLTNVNTFAEKYS